MGSQLVWLVFFSIVDDDGFDHGVGDLGRDVERTFALARLAGEVAHQVFVGVAEQDGALGVWLLRKSMAGLSIMKKQVGEADHHLLALAQFVGVVKVGDIDHAFEIKGFSEPADDL